MPSVLIFCADLLLENAKAGRSPKPQGSITGRRESPALWGERLISTKAAIFSSAIFSLPTIHGRECSFAQLLGAVDHPLEIVRRVKTGAAAGAAGASVTL